MLAYGIYETGRYAPTRLNPADHTTRDAMTPEPLLEVLPSGQMRSFDGWTPEVDRKLAQAFLRLMPLPGPLSLRIPPVLEGMDFQSLPVCLTAWTLMPPLDFLERFS